MAINSSFHNVQKFLDFLDERPSCSLKKVNVLVHNGRQHLYRNINMSITFQPGPEDYKIDLIWEDDDSQPEYKSLGLHGYYSTNFQKFTFSNGILTFTDGANHITIMPLN